MKKVILFLILMIPLLAGAQIRIQQLGSKDQPAGRIIETDGANSFRFADITAATITDLIDSIRANSVQTVIDSIRVEGTILKIYNDAGKVDSVDLSTALSNAGAIDSMKFSTGYLKIWQNGSAIADSVLIDISGSETDPVFTAWDKDYNDLTNKPTITDNQTAAEVPITDSGNYFSSTDVEGALQELGSDVASGGDNWGTQVVETSTGLSGNGTTASPLAVTITGNATHTGEVTGSTSLTVADNVIDYGNVAATLKGNTTNNTLSWDVSGSGIITSAISSSGTVSFSNPQVNKFFTVVLTISSGATISWPASAKILAGSATLADGTFYVYIHCISSSLYTISITQEAS